MGANQSNITKDTFIHIDTKGIDGSAKDPRKNKSWGGPATHPPPADDDVDEVDSEVTEESMSVEEPADDWITDCDRLKTFDHVEADQAYPWTASGRTAESTDVQSNLACESSNAAQGAATKLDGSFWSSWNISDNARKAMQERVTSSASNGDQKVGVHDAVDPKVARLVPYASAQQAPQVWMQVTIAAQTVGSSGPLPTLFPAIDGNIRLEKQRLPSSITSSTSSAKASDMSTWTCRMVRNLPNDYSRQDVLEMLESKQLQFDFVYLPVDWGKRANLGYTFVNLVSHEEAERIEEVLNGFTAWKVPSEKVCEVVWGKPEQQSLHRNIERFRNSPVMHPDVPEEFKPLLFTLGQRTVFPAPTKRLQRPRGLNGMTAEDA